MSLQNVTFDVASEATSQEIKSMLQNIQVGAGYSVVVVEPKSDMVGQTLSLTIANGETVTKEVESTSLILMNVHFVGTYTMTCGNYESIVEVKQMGGIYYSTWGTNIIITFTASEAIGETITAKQGNVTVSTVVRENQKAVLDLETAGDWVVNGRTINVPQLGSIVSVTEDIYGYDWQLSESDPESCITYPSTVTNKNYSNITARTSAGEVPLGDWATFRDSFLECRPVMLNFGGTVAYELDHNDQTKKIDGSSSGISDTSLTMNAMVEFPKRYIKRYTSNGVAHFRISRMKLDGYKCLPWLYGNNEQSAKENDVIYLPMFEGSNINSKARSIAGQTPMNTQAGATEYSEITALGSGWQFDDWSDKAMITDFMFMMGKSTDVQKHHGNGHYSGGSSASSLLQTGGTKSYGSNYGGNNNSYVKFLWLENYFGDRWERTFGVYLKSGVLYVKNFPPYTTDGTVSNYTNLGRGINGTSGGYISEVSYDENGMIPKTVSGSDSTYVPDGCWFNNSDDRFLVWGADCYGGLRVGVAFHVNNPFSHSIWGVGASPAYKPQAA